MMILYNAGVALLVGLILLGGLGLEVLHTLVRSRVRVPVQQRRADHDLSQSLSRRRRRALRY